MNNLDWTYDGAEHERQQLMRDARLPPMQKLQWLEDAHHMVLWLQNQTSSTRCSENAKTDELKSEPKETIR